MELITLTMASFHLGEPLPAKHSKPEGRWQIGQGQVAASGSDK